MYLLISTLCSVAVLGDLSASLQRNLAYALAQFGVEAELEGVPDRKPRYTEHCGYLVYLSVFRQDYFHFNLFFYLC